MSRSIVRILLGGGEGTLAVPLALAGAARIQERNWEDFLEDPTQLANGVRDLLDAVSPDGVPVSDAQTLLDQAGPSGLVDGAHAKAAVEATARLRQSLADRAALVTVIPGPNRLASHGAVVPDVVGAVVELGKQFLGAGADVVLVTDEPGTGGNLGTLANIARFHQALALSLDADDLGLPVVARVPLSAPSAATGVVVTDEVLGSDVDFSALEDWVDDVHP